MLLTRLDQIELDAFCRTHSPLTVFARSLRMEQPESGSSADDTKGGVRKDEPSILKDIDLTTLPDDVREMLQKKDVEFKSILTERETLKTEKDKVETFARNQQARADRNFEKLRQHNLHEEGVAPNKGKDAKETLTADLTQQFIAGGMKPELAGTYAAMFATAAPAIATQAANEVTRTVAPMAGAVQTLQIESAFEIAQRPDNDPNDILNIPEVDKQVREQVMQLAGMGTQIDATTILNLRNMAYGEYIQKNPDHVRGGIPTSGVLPNLNTRGGGRGNLRGDPTLPTIKGPPIARDAETQRAAQTVVDLMTAGLKKR